jgi:lipopolysaccharide transport system permease protein
MGSALFYSLISTVVLLLAQLIIKGILPCTCLLFLLVLLPLVFAGMGFAWFLAALGVFVRDIGQITGILTTMLMFMSPVFYPLSALPKVYQGWLQLNPLTLIIEESRKVLVFGCLPDWPSLGIAMLGGLAIAAVGFWWFQKTRKGFADVL